MAQYCRNCKTKEARIINSIYFDNGKIIDSCNECSNVRSTGVSDTYLGPGGGIKTEENLCDPKSGIPIPFSSKKEKAAIMKRLKLEQHPSAERHHGARNEKYLKGKRLYG